MIWGQTANEANELTSLSNASRNSGVLPLNRFKVSSGNSKMKLKTKEYSLIWKDESGGFLCVIEYFPHLSESWPADKLHSSEWANNSDLPQQDTPNPDHPKWLTRLFFHPLTAHHFHSYLLIHCNTSPPSEGKRKGVNNKATAKRGWSWEHWCCGVLHRKSRTTDCRHARALLLTM